MATNHGGYEKNVMKDVLFIEYLQNLQLSESVIQLYVVQTISYYKVFKK